MIKEIESHALLSFVIEVVEVLGTVKDDGQQSVVCILLMHEKGQNKS